MGTSSSVYLRRAGSRRRRGQLARGPDCTGSSCEDQIAQPARARIKLAQGSSREDALSARSRAFGSAGPVRSQRPLDVAAAAPPWPPVALAPPRPLGVAAARRSAQRRRRDPKVRRAAAVRLLRAHEAPSAARRRRGREQGASPCCKHCQEACSRVSSRAGGHAFGGASSLDARRRRNEHFAAPLRRKLNRGF